MNDQTKDKILAILKDSVSNTIERLKNAKTKAPFHEALLTKGILAASQFERSFSTSFGQSAIEDISYVIALENAAKVNRQYEVVLDVTKSALDEIDVIINDLRAKKGKPNWQDERKRVIALQKGDRVPRKIIADLHLIHQDGTESFITIKTVKPNLDQVAEAKRLLLKLVAHDQQFKTFIGFYYNPFGENRAQYKWNFSSKLFNTSTDSCVLIGKDYWDYLGGKGTYEELLAIFAQASSFTKNALEEAGLL